MAARIIYDFKLIKVEIAQYMVAIVLIEQCRQRRFKGAPIQQVGQVIVADLVAELLGEVAREAYILEDNNRAQSDTAS